MGADAERGEAPPDVMPTPSAHDASVEPGLTSAVAIARLSQDGPNEVPEKKPHTARQFARKLWGASAWMLELIVLLSFVLHKRADFWIALSTARVQASPKPESWNIGPLLRVAVILGMIMVSPSCLR
jgi:magnesium-transporting ATPase (P-type)